MDETIIKPLSIYVHVPFCKSKCAYCDFLSFPARPERGADDMRGYFTTLNEELKRRSEDFRGCYVKTVFIGGGTPSYAPSGYLTGVLRTIYTYFNMDDTDAAEITIEANPESAGLDKLSEYKSAGANRISFGVQSFSDAILKRIGRAHNAREAEAAYENALRAGFDNINIDLMFSLPGQTPDDLSETLKKASAFKPAHISLYGLTLSEGCALYNDKNFTETDDDTDRRMYHESVAALARAGYGQYEISNFALPGRECAHNMVYWTGGDYLGAGLGAHSFISGARFCNTPDLREYMSGAYEKKDYTVLSERDRRAEFFFLGLRLTNGVSADDFRARFGVSADGAYGAELKKLAGDGLIIRNGDNIQLTEYGVDISNRVFECFI